MKKVIVIFILILGALNANTNEVGIKKFWVTDKSRKEKV